jgi:hypothetical protein
VHLIFTQCMEVIPVTMYNENEVLAFNNGHFHHPSHVHKKALSPRS